MTFSIVASVGTYHHPFDRLAGWLERWVADEEASLVFQHGSTRPIDGAENHEMLDVTSLLELYRAADAVVLQGGAGGIMDARRAGRIPIVVPRIPVDDEVVDEHQVKLGQRLAAMGLVLLAESEDELDDLLTGIRDGTVETRLTQRGVSDGLALTIQHLTEFSESVKPPRRSRLRQRAHRVVVAAQTPLVRAVVPPMIVAGLALAWVQASLGTALASLAAVLATVVLTLLCTPSSVRSRSWAPAAIQLLLGGGVLAVLTTAGRLDSVDYRPWSAALVGGVLGSVAVALWHRWQLQRGAVIVVGGTSEVAEVVACWSEDRILNIVATCVWPDDGDSVPETQRIVNEVVAAVARHHAARVVFASGRAAATEAAMRLVVELGRTGVECLALTGRAADYSAIRPVQIGDAPAVELRPAAGRSSRGSRDERPPRPSGKLSA